MHSLTATCRFKTKWEEFECFQVGINVVRTVSLAFLCCELSDFLPQLHFYADPRQPLRKNATHFTHSLIYYFFI